MDPHRGYRTIKGLLPVETDRGFRRRIGENGLIQNDNKRSAVTIMNHEIIDIGVASQISAYSDAIEVRPNLRWMTTSGTPGLASEGRLGVPKDCA
jgi:hypothetical protein